MKSLSARLLVFTIITVMISEVLIYVPSISRFRKVWFEARIASAELAALATEVAMGENLPQELQNRLLDHAGAHGIALTKDGMRIMALSMDMPTRVDQTVLMKDDSIAHLLKGAFQTLVQNNNRILRVIGPSTVNPKTMVEVILDESPLRMAMYDYSERILALSIVVSLFTAAFVYLSLQWLMVRPMGLITRSMIRFREKPEDDEAIIQPSGASDEIGIAQQVLAAMQRDLQTALKEKTRLAALGSAVAKINHDLRNTLATAMLISDRLAKSEDPDVREIAPRLIEAIDKAVTLCSHTLHFVGETGLHLFLERLYLSDLFDETKSAVRPIHLAHDAENETIWENHIPQMFEIDGDMDQLVRAVGNLVNNAIQAGATKLSVSAEESGPFIKLYLTDNGPGMPDIAIENLFKPFQGSARKGGTGLGLIIAKDIMQSHGGALELDSTGKDGSTFLLTFPKPVEDEEANP
ncbi:MAG: HAMP domain-containing histidine kinase [Rhodospirillales bacterium]|nr:HAMP domain-containing histidine kinase [Rhodospirillales bacterium]